MEMGLKTKQNKKNSIIINIEFLIIPHKERRNWWKILNFPLKKIHINSNRMKKNWCKHEMNFI